MSRIDQIIADVQSQNDTTGRTRALIDSIKHWVAEALAGAKLPQGVSAQLAEIFPALGANAEGISTALSGGAPAAKDEDVVMNMNDPVVEPAEPASTDAPAVDSGTPSES